MKIPNIIPLVTSLGFFNLKVGFFGSLNIFQLYPQIVECVHSRNINETKVSILLYFS